MKQESKKSDYDFLSESIVNISKAGAYDIVSKQRDELVKENEELKKKFNDAFAMYEAAQGMEIIKQRKYDVLRDALKLIVEYDNKPNTLEWHDGEKMILIAKQALKNSIPDSRV